MDRPSYRVGETVTLTWRSQNTSYATWLPDRSGIDNFRMGGDRLDANGVVAITADVIGNPFVVMKVVGPGGSSTCSKVVPVLGAQSQTSCPQVNPPSCPGGTLISRGTDNSGCSLGYDCRVASAPEVWESGAPLMASASVSMNNPLQALAQTLSALFIK